MSLFSSRLLALSALWSTLWSSGVIADAPLNDPTFVGCFSSSTPLSKNSVYNYQSSGHCWGVCSAINKPVLGLSDGDECWCGDELPAANSKVAGSLCSTPCNGYDLEDCGGGTKYFTVWLTGVKDSVPNYDPKKTSSSHTLSSSSAAASSSSMPAPKSTQRTSTKSTQHSSTKSTKKSSTKSTQRSSTKSTQRSSSKTTAQTTLAAVTTRKAEHSPTSTVSADNSNSQSSSSSSNTSTILGVVLGLTAFTALVLMGLIFWCIWRRRKRASSRTRYFNDKEPSLLNEPLRTDNDVASIAPSSVYSQGPGLPQWDGQNTNTLTGMIQAESADYVAYGRGSKNSAASNPSSSSDYQSATQGSSIHHGSSELVGDSSFGDDSHRSYGSSTKKPAAVTSREVEPDSDVVSPLEPAAQPRGYSLNAVYSSRSEADGFDFSDSSKLLHPAKRRDTWQHFRQRTDGRYELA